MSVPGVVLHPRCAGIALAALLGVELLEDKILRKGSTPGGIHIVWDICRNRMAAWASHRHLLCHPVMQRRRSLCALLTCSCCPQIQVLMWNSSMFSLVLFSNEPKQLPALANRDVTHRSALLCLLWITEQCLHFQNRTLKGVLFLVLTRIPLAEVAARCRFLWCSTRTCSIVLSESIPALPSGLCINRLLKVFLPISLSILVSLWFLKNIIWIVAHEWDYLTEFHPSVLLMTNTKGVW